MLVGGIERPPQLINLRGVELEDGLHEVRDFGDSAVVRMQLPEHRTDAPLESGNVALYRLDGVADVGDGGGTHAAKVGHRDRNKLRPGLEYLAPRSVRWRMRALLVVVVLMGCACGSPRLPGAPIQGKACTTEKPECSSADSVSICEMGKWADYSCPSNCSNNQTTRCDWSQAKMGEACPKSFEGSAMFCNATGTGLVGCLDGGITEMPMRCPSCVVHAWGITCA